jgi:Domain of unknown function (DUF1707)
VPRRATACAFARFTLQGTPAVQTARACTLAHARPGQAAAGSPRADNVFVPDDKAPPGGETAPGLRASDADRDRALAQLQDALATGMIEMAEFHDRSGRALSARTRGELAAITSDLPAVPETRASVIELRGTASPVKRTGRWLVPRQLVVHQQHGSAELDFTQAQISHPVTGIELDVDGGSVEIRLPDGASASTDGVEAIRSSVEDHRKDPPPSGRPHFVITGTIQRGSLELRGPRRRPFRKR